MQPKLIAKLCVDVGMTLILLLLMTYELIGQAAHEWLGVGMFALFVIHHILNSKWSRNILKSSYTPLRIWQTILVILILLCMVGSIVSGVILSRHVFSFLPITGGYGLARSLHIISAYWGFVWMSLHLGLHWSMMMAMARKSVCTASPVRTWILRVLAILIAIYGVFAFVKRDVGSYMLLQNQFVFFDFEEPLLRFLLDYMSIMGLFVCIGHCLAEFFRRHVRRAARPLQ